MRRFEPRNQRHSPSVAPRAASSVRVGALLCAVAIVLAAFVGACDQGDTTSTSRGTDEASDASRAVTFITNDGVALGGHLFGTGSKGVILAHMYPADQTSWFATAERLAAQGYLVLTFDFRGYGESKGDKQIERIDRDVLAAANEIGGAGATEVVLVGASMGGTACLRVAGEIFASMISSQSRPPYEIPPVGVAGVVTLSAPVEFMGLSVTKDVPMPVCPLLFIAAEEDVGAEGAAALEKLSRNQGDLQIVPGDDHGTALLEGAAADQVWALLSGFLAENLPLDPSLP
jgi:uncharacterized protein